MSNTKVYSFRFSNSTLDEIDYLLEDEKKIAWDDRRKAKNRLEIVEDAINEKYLRRVNQIQGAELKEQIGKIISEKVNKEMKEIKEEMDELLFLSIKNDLGNRVFYRSPSVLPAPDSKAQAIDVIINEESMWDLALEEYMKYKWSKEKVHHHEIQKDE
jgi:plasmid maintenance system killer protein